ncbi:hypothetical protein [Mucisphaera calidilacus]|uniref:Uncharacterized protein n=1 Tax=Mucisphaera calidilacus TaxID=2527982 RepID=A0A518BZU3_9BACT|nr:hypothetical protein [Mucisphaera calidilacus]QDU72492.1 hypothetical protein Pan265_23580 [Mucisphaera calidilacus]
MLRWLTIGGATAVALVFLVLAFQGGPEIVEPEGPSEPVALPQGWQQQEATDPGSLREATLEGGSIFLAEQKTWVTWSSMRPEPDGVFDIDRPRARTAVGDGAVLEIVADSGRFLVPDRQPRSGSFRGNVLINLYRGRNGLPPRYGEDVDVIGRAYLDEVRFDLELGMLETSGPLHMTGPMFDFRGEGLLVRFNQRANRLEELRVDRGEGLRLKLDGVASTAPDRPRAERDGTGPEDAVQTTDGQLYAMLVDGGIRGLVRGDEAVLTGERIEVLYRTRGDGGGGGADLATLDRDGTDSGTESSTDASVVAGAGRSLCPIAADDTIVTWTGALVVRPAQEEAVFARVPAGQLVGRLVGAPSTLIADSVEVLAGAIGFSSERTELWAESLVENEPVRLTSGDAGVVIAQRMSYTIPAREAAFVGPGVWEAAEGSARGGAKDLVWSDAMRFRLSDASGKNHVLGRVLEAEVRGAVSATHVDGHLEAERLSLVRLDDASAAVLAEGGLIGSYAPQTEDAALRSEPVRLVSESAELMLQAFEDRLDPTRLRARGDAKLVQGRTMVSGETLTGELVREEAGMVLERFTALDEVSARDGTRGVDLTGDRLEILPAAGEARLFGGFDRDQWATVQQAQSALHGSEIVVVNAGDVVSVEGAGRVEHLIPGFDPDAEPVADPLLPGLEVRDRREMLNIPDTLIEIDWLGGMTFNRPSGWARATGGVRGTYVKGSESGRASGQELRVELDRQPRQGTMAFALEGADAGVRALLLSGDAELAWGREDAEAGDTSVTLNGPSIAYDRPSAEAAVLGAGWLLYEGRGEVMLTGQSEATGMIPTGDGPQKGFMQWHEVLTMDLSTGRATASGGVEMIYETDENEPSVYLDAERATAVFEGVTPGDAAQARLVSVEALERVQVVREDRLITADGLKFDVVQSMVELWADDGGLVRQASEQDITGLAARRVRWYLDRDEIDILRPAPVVVPMGNERFQRR